MLREKIIDIMNKEMELAISQLHPFYQKYLEIFRNSSEAPLEYILTALLTAIGSAVSLNRYIKLGTHQIFPNFWVLLLGSSTQMRKSTALKNGTSPLSHFQTMHTNRDYILPVRTSVQALLDSLKHEKNGIIMQDEIATFLATLGQGYNADMKSLVTSCFDVPEQLKTDFLGAGKTVIKQPIFSIASASTPQWLKTNLKQNDVTSGFLARFLFCYQKENSRVIPFPSQPDSNKLKLIYDRFEKFYALQPAEMSFDAEFRQLYEDFYKESRQLINNIRTENGLKAVFSRLQTDYFFKFAILEGVLSGRLILTRDDAERAIYLCTFFMAEATKVIQIIDQTKQTSLEKRVLKIIGSSPGVTKTQIHKEFSNHLPAKKLNNVISHLLKAERIAAITKQGKNGRSLTAYQPISL